MHNVVYPGEVGGGGRGVAKIWAKMGWDNWEFDCDILQKEVTGLYIFYWT
jgi:hypothetical protein